MLFPSLKNRGGFFSDYYLGTVFGRASGRRKSLVTKEVDAAFRTLQRLHERAEQKAGDVPALRETYARPLLRDVFGYHLGEGEKQIHPLFGSAEDEAQGRPPLLLAYIGDFDEDLDAKRDGKAPPIQRLAAELARAKADLRYGLLLTGERIRLTRRKGDGPAGAYLELDLPACVESEDRDSFAAAHRLFRAGEFVPDEDGKRPIDGVEEESREHAKKVSEDLKRAVFGSSETLVQALLGAPRGHDDPDPELTHLRDAALTCLYRLLFILYAEARDERLMAHAIYRDSYSLDALVRELSTHREPPSANRTGLWERLLALFALHRDGLPGVEGLDPLPARGGALFDPTTPAGQILQGVRLDDATVARLVLDLTTTSPRRGVGKERVSFRELDIEQLGSVYEGLLEYEPRVAQGTTIEVKVQGRTYALSPAELVRLVREKNLKLKGPQEIVAGTEAEPLHPEATADDQEANEVLEAEEAEDAAPEAEAEGDGVKKGAPAILVRRLEPGDFHFVPGPGRKGSGSFYTPLPLVQDLVRHALGPLVEDRTPAEIESLRVLDPACGSAHFLVEAMRFLGRALHGAYVRELGGKAPPGFVGTWDANHEASDEDARAAGSEARAWCKRRIAERCLFGVDLNPTAVQLAQVSLWIESLAGDRPLTYFTHHVRCGNSILGTWLERLGEPPLPELRARQAKDGGLMQDIFATQVREAVLKAADVRRQIDEADVAVTAVGADADPLAEERFKEARRREAEEILAAARMLFDLRSASAFVPKIWADWPNLCDRVGDATELARYARSRRWWDAFERVRERERFFHWELEFPEVFLDAVGGGFDAVLGNPPWDKVKPDRKEFYGRYDVLIRAFVGGELDARIRELQATIPGLDREFEAYEERVKTIAACLKKGGDYRFQDWEVDGKSTGGDPDAFKFFVERAHRLAREGGGVGFVVPSAIYNNEGCTGLRNLLLREAQVERFYAFENRKKIFPIHSSYKFVSLVFRKGEPGGDGFEAAFMRHELEELADPGPKDFMVLVRRRELERLSPGTLAFLEYRSPRDREILLKMYGYDKDGNPVNPRPLLGDQGPGTWNARFYREFDMTNDRDLWTDPKTGKLYNPRQILGPVPGTTSEPPYYDPKAWPEIRARMAEKGFWPLYEGKHIEQFLVDIRPIERWVSLEACEEKNGKLPEAGRKLVFRDIARNTDERTCIASVLPPKSCANHKLPVIRCEEWLAPTLLAVLNSFAFDFGVRLRAGSTSLTFSQLSRCPVLPPGMAPTPPIEHAISAPGVDHITDLVHERDWLLQVESVAVAQFGLTTEDMTHVLKAFPVFARKHPAFFELLLSRVGEEA
jgi:hypothetical protein